MFISQTKRFKLCNLYAIIFVEMSFFVMRFITEEFLAGTALESISKHLILFKLGYGE